MASNLISQWCGLQPYQKGQLEQKNCEKKLRDLIVGGQGVSFQKDMELKRQRRQAYVLGFEFYPVVTLGKRGSVESDILIGPGLETNHDLEGHKIEEQSLKDDGRIDFEIYRVERGGQAVLHNPGQLVIYPILSLRDWNFSVRFYVETLLRVTGEVLKGLGIESFVREGSEPGVYTSQGKIAFVGLRVDRGVSSHGIAINVSNCLADFGAIRSCGVQAAALDRVIDWSGQEDMQCARLFEAWCWQFNSFLAEAIEPRVDAGGGIQ